MLFIMSIFRCRYFFIFHSLSSSLNPSPKTSDTSVIVRKASGSISLTILFNFTIWNLLTTQYIISKESLVYPPEPSNIVTPLPVSS